MPTAESVKATLDRKGRSVTFKKTSTQLEDENKPWGKSIEVPSTFDTISVFIDYETKELDGERIKASDKKLLVNTIDPVDDIESYEEVIDGKTTWRIKSVNEIKPGNIAFMYEVQIRK